ncbi:nuclear RNA export factor 1-like [Tribolium madens]|uniref:nuclear RNA export factor 1-like n=1 Tax=Tribolium madens TaxID=41895 RepID=UPI001CF749FE|nr:nuclear RNA export factor 1-like [Tribolium madens]
MASKGGKYNKPSWRSQYSEHDFRGGNDTRKVSFKSNKYKKDNRNWAAAGRAYLEDEDIDMGGSSGGGRNFNRKQFKGRRGARGDSPAPNHKKRRLLEGPMSWFRVTLPFGNKYEKSFILKTLLEKIQPLPLWPITWSVNGTTATFYVDEFKVAEKLHDLDRQIQMPDGFRLLIKVSNGIPNVDVNSQMKEKIKLTMAKRYNAANKALDLTKFHADPDLQDCFCALFKPIVFITVLEIIAENIPEIEAINLFDNKIANLSYLKKTNEKLPHLKILHVGNNKFKDLSMLDPFIGLPIIDIVLNGNPLCNKYKDQEAYIGEVRKRFPKVMKLDGIDLPPPISFDIQEETHLPTIQQTFLCNQEGESIVRQFLEQYFLIFDSENRQPLLQAYHESALFSMTMSYPYGQRDKNASWLNWYTTDNRNLQKVQDPDRRHKLLKQGQVAVVSFLQEMPRSKHDIHSFTVDLVVFTPQMIVLTVTGMFKELKSGHKVPPTRAFFRTLVIVPAGSGFCISNETLHITNATDEQAKNIFKTVVSAPPPTPVASPVATPAPIDEATKQQMVTAMAEQSNMNLEWSRRCLEETQWDFTRALSAFAGAQKQGLIPPEAFVK